jgi:hypothetical protein
MQPSAMLEKQKNNELGYDVAKASIDPSKTTASMVDDLTSKNTPSMKLAVGNVTKAATSRGLINRAMMAGQAQKAKIETALPIAAQDSQNALNVELSNQSAENAMRSQRLTGSQTLNQIEGSGIESLKQIDANRDAEAALMANRAGYDKDLAVTQGDITRQNIGASRDAEAALMTNRAGYDREMEALKAGFTKEQIAAQRDAEAALLTNRAGYDQQLALTQGEIARQNIGANRDAEAALMAQRANYDTLLQKMRGDQAEALTGIEMKFESVMQASQSASVMFSNTANSISNILAQPDIPEAQKQSLINSQIKLLENYMSVAGALSNLDLSGLIDFSTTTPGTTASTASDPAAAGSATTQQNTGAAGYDNNDNGRFDP